MTRSTMISLFLAALLSNLAMSAHASERGAGAPASSRNAPDRRTNAMKISITAGDKVITATLVDNATSRDFIALLPITLTFEDYASTEKISYLPRKLSTEGAPAGSDPSAGDIAYYTPWGNLAVFYKDFGYSSGLVKLGKIESGLEALNVRGSMRVTVALLDN